MDYTYILYELIDDVAFIRMNQPDTLNAMTAAMGRELLHAVGRANGEARAILIGSVGRGFCSGLNLSEGGVNTDDPQRDVGAQLDSVFNPLVYQMRDAGIPVITAVRGAAAGVGCGIALAGDLIVAGEGAIFYHAFAKLGLAPDGGSSYFAIQAVGRVRAMEMMLLASKLPASKALDWGLINRVVPDDQVDDAALDLARELARGPKSLGIIKRVVWAAADAAFETALSKERVGQREAGRTEDFAEGVRAFREKRAPRFSGR